MINYIVKIAAMAVDVSASSLGIDKLTAVLFWIARAVVIAVGGGVSIIKIVKGKSDETPKDFNEGMVILVSTGVIFAATFAVQAAFS